MYAPEDENGVRWNDSVFNIHWPMEPKVISSKDQNWSDSLSNALSEKKYLTFQNIIIYWLLVLPKNYIRKVFLWFAHFQEKRTMLILREKRLELLKDRVNFIYDCPYGSPFFLEIVQ